MPPVDLVQLMPAGNPDSLRLRDTPPHSAAEVPVRRTTAVIRRGIHPATTWADLDALGLYRPMAWGHRNCQDKAERGQQHDPVT